MFCCKVKTSWIKKNKKSNLKSSPKNVPRMRYLDYINYQFHHPISHADSMQTFAEHELDTRQMPISDQDFPNEGLPKKKKNLFHFK